MNHAEAVAAARYVVQKYRRLKDARDVESQPHTTPSALETAQRAAFHAETMFNCAMEELAAEFPDA